MKKQTEVLKICKQCSSVREKKLIGMTCGNFLHVPEKIPNTCGCALNIKTILNFITKCPQGKW